MSVKNCRKIERRVNKRGRLRVCRLPVSAFAYVRYLTTTIFLLNNDFFFFFSFFFFPCVISLSGLQMNGAVSECQQMEKDLWVMGSIRLGASKWRDGYRRDIRRVSDWGRPISVKA